MPPNSNLNWLERSFVFYSSYHHHPTNQLIHIVFVWQILFTLFTMLAYTKPFDIRGGVAFHQADLPASIKDVLPSMVQGNVYVLNWNLLLCGTYFFYYLIIEQGQGFAGLLCSALVLFAYVGSTAIFQNLGNAAFNWAVGLHVIAWVAQFIGHGVFEKRSPALFSNLFQAFAMAPLFVVLEVLFSLGYRPEIKAKCEKEVKKQLKAWAGAKK